jgi:hypothetical protein
MNPDTKMILDELRKTDARWEQRFADLDAKWDRRFAEADSKVEARLSALEQGAASGEDVEARVAALEKSGVSDLRIANIEKVVASYEDWQPGVEGTLDDMKLAVLKLNKYLDRVVIDSPPLQVRRHLQVAGVGVRAPICRIHRRRASWPP